MADKLIQQVDFLQRELMKLKEKVSRLYKNDYFAIRVIKLELNSLLQERKKLIEENKDTKRNAGKILMCRKIISLVSEEDFNLEEDETTVS